MVADVREYSKKGLGGLRYRAHAFKENCLVFSSSATGRGRLHCSLLCFPSPLEVLHSIVEVNHQQILSTRTNRSGLSLQGVLLVQTRGRCRGDKRDSMAPLQTN